LTEGHIKYSVLIVKDVNMALNGDFFLNFFNFSIIFFSTPL